MRRYVAAAALLGVGGLVFILARTAFLAEEHRQEIAAAERLNAPDLILENGSPIQYPDPLHLRLADGRVFRTAHLACPDPGTPEFAKALEAAPQPLATNGALKRGLRLVGRTTDGEILVEPWGLFCLPHCGLLSAAERRRLDIPSWNNLTGQLIGSGYYWLAPGETDPTLLALQRAARSEGLGVWADPSYLRRLVDLAECEAILRTPGAEHNLRLESAALLVRVDPKASRPRLMERIVDAQDPDISLRTRLALMLEKSGDPQGIAFLRRTLTGMEAYALHQEETSFAQRQALQR